MVDPDRIVLGVPNFDANVDFFANLSPRGPFVVIMPARQANWNAQNRHYEIHVEVRIYFALPADKTNDFMAIEDLVYGEIFQAVAAIASWNVGVGLNPTGIPAPDVPYNEDGPTIDPSRKPLPGMYSLTFSFFGNTQS